MVKHHAYLFYTDNVKPESVYALIKEFGVVDVRYVDEEVIGIENARSIIGYANVRPSNGLYQLIVICTKSIRVEAQQALLKILEEPPATTKFIVCVPTNAHLLPTLLSRLSEYKSDKEAEIKINTEFGDFKKLSYGERLSEISTRIDKKDTVWIEQIRAGLSQMLTKEIANLEKTTVHSLNMVVENLNQRGSSNKMLLEELALSLPL